MAINQGSPFSITRFNAPWQHDSTSDGWTLFMDPDMLVRCDIAKVFKHADPRYAVLVVKHDYVSGCQSKYVGGRLAEQLPYPRKNWSSMMLMNHRYRDLWTLDRLKVMEPLHFHQFRDLPDALIGELPAGYNYLVGEPQPAVQPKVLHFTLGTPCSDRSFTLPNCEAFYLEWLEESRKAGADVF